MTQRRADDDVLHSCSINRTEATAALQFKEPCTRPMACLSTLTSIFACRPPSSWPAAADMAACSCSTACSVSSSVLQRSKTSAASEGDCRVGWDAGDDEAAAACASRSGRNDTAAAAAAAAAAATAKDNAEEEEGLENKERMVLRRKGAAADINDLRSVGADARAGAKARVAAERRRDCRSITRNWIGGNEGRNDSRR
jgi:hypothetical protein